MKPSESKSRVVPPGQTDEQWIAEIGGKLGPLDRQASDTAPRKPEDWMVTKAEAASKKAMGGIGKDIEAIEWVLDFYGIRDVTFEDAPSARAWSLLQWCRSDPKRQDELWSSMYPKIWPSKQALEVKREQDVDEERIDRLLCKLIREGQAMSVLPEGSEDLDGEPWLPPLDSAVLPGPDEQPPGSSSEYMR